MARVRPSASVLLPLIESPLGDPASPRYFAALQLAGALSTGGSNAVPSLVRALDSTNHVAVSFAWKSLGDLGPAAREAIPALIKALDGPNYQRALAALGNIGPDARSAIPRIEQLWKPEGGIVPCLVATALCRIDPQHPSLGPLIAQAADHDDLGQTSAAIYLLGVIGPAAKPALPVLLAALTEPVLALLAAQALHKIDPANRQAEPLLLKYCAAGDLNAVIFASFLARWEPPHEAAIAALARLVQLEADEGQRVYAMSILYEVGPRAQAAIPAIEAAARDANPIVRDAARVTLRRVRGDPQR